MQVTRLQGFPPDSSPFQIVGTPTGMAALLIALLLFASNRVFGSGNSGAAAPDGEIVEKSSSRGLTINPCYFSHPLLPLDSSRAASKIVQQAPSVGGWDSGAKSVESPLPSPQLLGSSSKVKLQKPVPESPDIFVAKKSSSGLGQRRSVEALPDDLSRIAIAKPGEDPAFPRVLSHKGHLPTPLQSASVFSSSSASAFSFKSAAAVTPGQVVVLSPRSSHEPTGALLASQANYVLSTITHNPTHYKTMFDFLVMPPLFASFEKSRIAFSTNDIAMLFELSHRVFSLYSARSQHAVEDVQAAQGWLANMAELCLKITNIRGKSDRESLNSRSLSDTATVIRFWADSLKNCIVDGQPRMGSIEAPSRSVWARLLWTLGGIRIFGEECFAAILRLSLLGAKIRELAGDCEERIPTWCALASMAEDYTTFLSIASKKPNLTMASLEKSIAEAAVEKHYVPFGERRFSAEAFRFAMSIVASFETVQSIAFVANFVTAYAPLTQWPLTDKNRIYFADREPISELARKARTPPTITAWLMVCMRALATAPQDERPIYAKSINLFVPELVPGFSSRYVLPWPSDRRFITDLVCCGNYGSHGLEARATLTLCAEYFTEYKTDTQLTIEHSFVEASAVDAAKTALFRALLQLPSPTTHIPPEAIMGHIKRVTSRMSHVTSTVSYGLGRSPVPPREMLVEWLASLCFFISKTSMVTGPTSASPLPAAHTSTWYLLGWLHGKHFQLRQRMPQQCLFNPGLFMDIMTNASAQTIMTRLKWNQQHGLSRKDPMISASVVDSDEDQEELVHILLAPRDMPSPQFVSLGDLTDNVGSKLAFSQIKASLLEPVPPAAMLGSNMDAFFDGVSHFLQPCLSRYCHRRALLEAIYATLLG